MPFIYKITNMITDKGYVGKTMYSVEKRWREHCHDYKRRRCEKRPLYDAMNKYGVENFTVKTLEECSWEVAAEREEYWIKKLGTFHYGYNATIGGEGKPFIDYETVVEVYCLTDSVTITAEILSIDSSQCRTIVKMYGVYHPLTPADRSRLCGKPVNMLSKSGEYIRSFDTSVLAAEYLLQQGLAADKHASKHILDVCKHKPSRDTAYGYKWEYMIPEDW